MATLRRFTLVKTRKKSRRITPERAIMLAFCAIIGGGVFLSLQPAGPGQPGQSARFQGYAPYLPIASHLARGFEGKGGPVRTASAPIAPANLARINAEKTRQQEIARLLAAERRRAAQQIFARINVDRTPVATIASSRAIKAQPAGGFRELAPNTSGRGFRELSPNKPPGE